MAHRVLRDSNRYFYRRTPPSSKASSTKILEKEKSTETFSKKVKLFDMGVKEQVEALNKMYDGKLEFGLDDFEKIVIRKVHNNFNVLDLPEIDNFSHRELIPYTTADNIITVKLPKTLSEIDARSSGWISLPERIFMWDTTVVDWEQFNERVHTSLSNLKLVVIQSSTGGKPKLIRF